MSGMSPTIGKTDGKYYIELSFAPSMSLVTIVRRFVSGFFDLVLDDPGLTAKLAVTVHELLENAVKFSRDGDAFIRVALSPEDPRTVEIETRNRASAEETGTLQTLFDEITAAASPMDFYVARMERSLDADRSQLGLARVLVEAGMELTYETKDELVYVYAKRPLHEAANA